MAWNIVRRFWDWNLKLLIYNMISDFYIPLKNPKCFYYPFKGGWGLHYLKGFKNGSFIKFLKWYFKKKFKNNKIVRDNLKKLKASKIPFVKKGLVCEFRNEGLPQVDFHLRFGKWKRTNVKQYNHRKIAGAEGFLTWYFDPDYDNPSYSYDRFDIVPISAFQDIYKKLCRHHTIKLGKYTIKDSKRYKVFNKSTKCVSCGIEGQYHALEVERGPFAGHHFNLYAVNKFGHEILMTVDHIVPLSKGGHNGIGNLQTMCKPCNSKKADKCI